MGLGEPYATSTGAVVMYIIPFLKRLEAARSIGRPYLAVAPDIVAGGLKSLDYSLSWMDRLPEWPWYLAVQDGMDPGGVAAVIGRFTGLFLGGTDRFKLQAERWCDLAHGHSKRFHYARAGTIRKLVHAYRIRADSLDSSFPLWSAERMKRFGWAVEGLDLQREMFA